MDPKLLLVDTLKTHVVPSMEQHGFTWSEAGPSFRRKRGDLAEVIKFPRSKSNRGDICSFWTTWGVRSKAFRSWYQATWSKAPSDDYLVITNDWLITDWPRSANGFSILNQPSRDAEEMKSLVQAFVTLGIQFLEVHSTPESAAEFCSNARPAWIAQSICW